MPTPTLIWLVALYLVIPLDQQLLEQAVVNFLDNAIKYSPTHGRIWVLAVQDETNVVIRVKDDGPGIANEHQARLFERFYRTDKARSRELDGTGNCETCDRGLEIGLWK